jgi:polyisoprenoid-binding protein YceI
MTTRFWLDPGHSRFTVQAFATGMLALLGHSPVFAATDFAGEISFEDELIANMRLNLTINAVSLELQGNVRAADREEIIGQMRREVLETAAYPQITYQATVASSERVAAGRYRVRLAGALTLCGVTQSLPADAELLLFDDGIRLRGECLLRMSEFRVKPVTALGGAIRLKDEVTVFFDLGALPEGP